MTLKKFAQRFPGFQQALADSGVTPEQCDAFQVGIFRCYDQLAASIPEGSKSQAWKTGKPAHARKALKEVGEFADLLGLTDSLISYVAIACSAHDLGRMVQANKRVGTQTEGYEFVFDDAKRMVAYDDNDERHGFESMLLLRPILGSFIHTKAGEWLLDAVLHHSLKQNPTLEMCGGSEESLALCGIVRDIDKVLGFQSAKDYTSNPQRKAKERLQNWGARLEADPEWGTELGKIDPAPFLMETPFEQPIDRGMCRSYEAYMLQFLKWLPGFTTAEMQEVALHEGGPQIVAAYLLKQLEASPDQRAVLLQQLQSWHDGALLRIANAA